MLDLYSGGEIEKGVYLTKKAETEQALQRRPADTAELQARLAAIAGMDPDREAELRRLRADIVERLDSASFEQKLKLLTVLAVQCIYDDETGQVMMTGAFGDQQLSLEANDDERGGPSSNGGSQASATYGGCRRIRGWAWTH
ncbi:MAG: hypothetical protein ABI847_09865 [Anaerolineales bacterium]